MSRTYFIPALVIALVWLTHSASALLIGNDCVSEMQSGAPVSAFNVSNLVSIGSRLQMNFIPIPALNVGSSQLSSNAMARATFQTSFWNEATGFHDLSSSPMFQFMPAEVAQQYFEPSIQGVPVWQPQLPPLFM